MLELILKIFTILGSLGLFLYGMKLMSESLQKVAGDGLHKILTSMTSNSFRGVFSGLLITAIIQASSATTVMLVSFVNAGLISLTESIGVMMGATIGTTIKIWFITLLGLKFNLTTVLLPLVGLSLPLMFSKSKIRKSWGEFIIGFSILFIGIGFLINLFPDPQNNPDIYSFITKFSTCSYHPILLFILFGAVFTALIQSSSATITLTIILTLRGIIPYDLAAALILGENIGTTITANLAAIIANRPAKRSAFSHTLFKLIGVMWMLPVFYPFINMVNTVVIYFAKGYSFTDSTIILISLCLFHTSFNILNTLLFIGFVNPFVKLLNILVPNKKKREKSKLKYIDSIMFQSPGIHIEPVQKEIALYGKRIAKMFELIPRILTEKNEVKYARLIDKITKYKAISDKTHNTISEYITKAAEDDLSSKESNLITSMQHINTHITSICDIIVTTANDIDNKNKQKIWFTQPMRNFLTEMFELVEQSFITLNEVLDTDYKNVNKEKSERLRDILVKLKSEILTIHYQDLANNEYTYKAGNCYLSIIDNYEKINNYCCSIIMDIKT
ncbi:MAG: Na/Pi cotransporter family protein [Bacteroidota bacterium]